MRHFLYCALLLTSPCWAALDIKEGQLDNGLRYLIKGDSKPAGKVELRLVVKTGSRHEDEDEKGIAHLVEHMAFRRTTHFAAGEIATFLNSQGMRWGNDSNAWTGWESTVYQLSSNTSALPKALQLTADWAGGIQFDAHELAQERKVVLDEMRLGQNNQKNWAEYVDVLYPGREYSNRMPIGEQSVIEKLPLQRITAFYRRHYIAPRMTLIVVGDIDAASVEKEIRSQFAHLASGPIPDAPAIATPNRQRQLFSNYQAYGLSNSAVSWGWQEEWNGIPSQAGMERDYMRSLALLMVQRRLQEKSDKSAYSQAYFFSENDIPHLQIWSLGASPTEGKAKQALEEIRFTAEQARRNGFSAAEVAEAYKIMRTNFETAAKQPLEQNQIITLLLGHVIDGMVADSPADNVKAFSEIEKIATPQRLQAELDQLMQSPGQLIKIMRAQSDNAQTFGFFTDDDIEQIENKAAKRQFGNGAREIKSSKLIDKLPKAGTITARKTIEGGEIWTLSNGLEVLWQKNTRADEKIGIDLRAQGGLLGLAAQQRLAGATLSAYQAQAGFRDLSGMQLNDALLGHSLNLNHWLNEDQHGISGTSAPDDLETALQVLHLSLQSPPPHHNARTFAIEQVKNVLSQRQDLNALLAHGEAWPWKSWSDQDFKLLLTDEIQTAHASLYGEPAILRLTLTGIRQAAQLETLITQYIASIPPIADRRPLKAISPLPITNNHISSGIRQEEAWLNWRFVSPQAVTANDALLASALADILQQRLLPILRHSEGLSYDVSTHTEAGTGRGIVINLRNTGASKQCALMLEKTISTLKTLAKDGPNDAEISSAIQREQRLLSDDAKVNKLAFNWTFATDLNHINPDASKTISRSAVHDVAQRWLKPQASFLQEDGCSSAFSSEQFLALWDK